MESLFKLGSKRSLLPVEKLWFFFAICRACLYTRLIPQSLSGAVHHPAFIRKLNIPHASLRKVDIHLTGSRSTMSRQVEKIDRFARHTYKQVSQGFNKAFLQSNLATIGCMHGKGILSLSSYPYNRTIVGSLFAGDRHLGNRSRWALR
jgi:hypothetical protein